MTISYEMGNNLYLNLTNRCTNRCNFCVRGKDTAGMYLSGENLWLEREPETEEIIEDLEKRAIAKYDSVVFCGFGEPVMRLEQLIAVGKWLRSNDAKQIRLNTNGQGNMFHEIDITPKLAEVLDVVSISLNASNAEKYDEDCASIYGEAAYEGVLGFANKCVKRGIKTVMTVVDVLSTEDVEVCKQIAESIGAEFRVRELI